MNELNKLNPEDRTTVLRAPALVSILAAGSEGGVNSVREADAIKMSHLRTFTAEPMLQPYYQEVEKNFVSQFRELIEKYTPLTDEKRKEVQEELTEVNEVIDKLNKFYGDSLRESLKSYAQHVDHAGRNVVEYLLLPLQFRGITD